jgi:prepilin-type N-terminal cleavage/methylation domain-containing protein
MAPTTHSELPCTPPPGPGRGRGGFTLLELLLAVAIFSIVLVAINTVFFASMRLRRSVTASIDAANPLNHALAAIRKDLQNAIGPAGTLAGNFRSGGPVGVALGQSPGSTTGGSSASTLGAGNSSQAGGLSFFTTVGMLRDDMPWGDIQEVNYQLLPSDQGDAAGKDLVRSVTRNLLTYATPTSEMQRLAGNVDQLEFQYYDGTQWRETWDTTIGDVGLPAAVRVRIQLVPEKEVSVRQEPIQMTVLLNCNIGTNTTASAETQAQ